MSWLFSRALVEEYLAGDCLDGELSALLSATATHPAFWSRDRTTESCPASQSGTTFEHSTGFRGADVLTWFRADFPVKPIPAQLRAKTTLTISGRKCDGSWQMSLPGSYLPRTSSAEQSTQRQTTLRRWVTKSGALPLARQTWVLTTFGADIGFVHTPTATANYAAPSMQKWPSCRSFVRAFGKPSPKNHEFLMGWPIGWTACVPLEMAKFQQWQQQHGIS
jgi:hypothetical protein